MSNAHACTCRATFLALFAAAWLSGSQPALAQAVGAWALAVALSRCLMGRHFLGDILAGLLVGIMTTAVVTQVGPVPLPCIPFLLHMLQPC
jgi:membrane-associated phospholipid phosphatase